MEEKLMERSNYSTNTEYLQSNSIDGYTISLKDHVYYAKVMPSVGTYELYDLIVRAITPTWFSTYDTAKGSMYSFLFENGALGKDVFLDRKEALNRVKYAEEHGKKFTEIEYEEY